MREEEIGERWPDIPEWADPRELDPEVRRDLRGLSKEGAEFVGAHLFVAGMLAEEDPELAWRHARAARSKGGRIAVVRETVGLVAYRAAEWAEAIAELRAARRMSGGPGQLPVIADCERALGHPEKAIELSRSAEAADLDPSSAAELRIVVAGARADLGQLDAALAHLEGAVQNDQVEPFSARLYYAYADLLLQAGRRPEALDWFMKAAEADVDEETDAGERLTELATGAGGADSGDAAGDEDSGVDSGEAVDAEERIVFGDELDMDPDAAIASSSSDATSPAEVSGEGRRDGDVQNEDDIASNSEVDGEDEVESNAEVEMVDEVETIAAAELDDDLDDDDARNDRGGAGDRDIDDDDIDDDDRSENAIDDRTDGPVRPARPPSSMSSLFSHHEGGS